MTENEGEVHRMNWAPVSKERLVNRRHGCDANAGRGWKW